jgi:NAD(P)-dependent dehydrogenase (short-subunit alcohol dehydrogenase family)
MANTVLITGTSTGIGYATARLFQQHGWTVIATMRSPENSDLATLENVICLPLDVTHSESIQRAVEAAFNQVEAIDVLVNNAGYGLVGAFEVYTGEQIERQFATNVFGLMAVTRALLAHFRQRRTGVIVNVASIGGRISIPLYSMYNATKWAVEGFSDALQYELEPFNIRVKVIEPGPIKTDFFGRSLELAQNPEIHDYEAFTTEVMTNLAKMERTASPPEVTAAVIYRAATDGSRQLRYPAGGNAGFLLFLRKLLPDSLFSLFIRASALGK